MLTKWGKKIVACAKSSSYYIPYISILANAPAILEAKSLTGDVIYASMGQPNSGFTALPITGELIASGSASSAGVAFGSGNTPPTENDYTLEKQVFGIAVGSTPSIATVYDTENYKVIARINYAVSNNTGSSITISEIGCFAKVGTATTRGAASAISTSARSILIDRTVLAQPVTIPNGGAAVIRYEFVYDA